MEYRQAVLEKSPMKAAIKQKAINAFQKMQSEFSHELKMVSAQVKSRRGTPLTNVERALNISNSSRNVAKLNITNQVQADKLVKLSTQAKFLGNGLAFIDFSSRVGNIHNSYQSDGIWERQMFIESSSFALSAAAGTAVVNLGSAALGFLVLATPIGWVGLIIGGATVAGAAAVTSMGINQIVKEDAGGIYDSIMEIIGSL